MPPSHPAAAEVRRTTEVRSEHERGLQSAYCHCRRRLAAPSPFAAAAVAAAAASSSKSLYHNYSSSTRDPCWKLDTHTISRDFAQLQLHILSSSRYSRPMHALQVSSPSLGNIHIMLDTFEWMKTSSNFIDDVYFEFDSYILMCIFGITFYHGKD